jgi:hypothetical protein
MCFHLVASIRARMVSPLVVLACTSFGTVLMCAILRVYPYGGIRQCLFLAPVLCLLASVSLVQVADRFAGSASTAMVVVVACVIAVSGVLQIRSVKPYAEVQDIQTVLHALQSRLEPGDGVYIYSGAVPALDFYLKERDQRFVYGLSHRGAPAKYVSEMEAGLRPETKRVWILFSHINFDEDKQILQELNRDWEVESALPAKGSALYLGRRRLAGGQTSANRDSR